MGEQGAANLVPHEATHLAQEPNLPWILLIGQGLALLLACLILDGLQVFPVDLDGYWATVKEMEREREQQGLRSVLTNVRTFGYPLLLKLVSLVSPELEALPLVHMGLRVLGTLAFYFGLRCAGVRPWSALVAASPLFYMNILIAHEGMVRGTLVLTDATGESLLILTVGLLLWVLGRPRSPLAWAAFSLALFLTYQTRPAYQFLVVLMPVLGLVLLGLSTSRPDWRRLRLRVGVGLAAACLLPFLAWCTLRLVLVGHFGLVCFTGYQLCALAGNFVTDDIVPELPADVRPYVQAVLERRDQIERGEVSTLFGTWRPSFDEFGHLIPGIIEDDQLYTLMAHDLFFTVAQEIVDADPATQSLHPWQVAVIRDKKQTAAALAIIWAQPGKYRQWIVATIRNLPAKIIWSNIVLFYLACALAATAVLWHVVWVARRIWNGPEVVAERGSGTTDPAWEVHLLLALGLGLAVPQGLLLALLATTSWGSRYADSPGVFLTAAAAVALLALLRRIGEQVGLITPARKLVS